MVGDLVKSSCEALGSFPYWICTGFTRESHSINIFPLAHYKGIKCSSPRMYNCIFIRIHV